MFKVFRVAAQKWKKHLNFEAQRTFSNALKFQILTFKKASNELFPKTKVVDLEILNNFGIQEFLI